MYIVIRIQNFHFVIMMVFSYVCVIWIVVNIELFDECRKTLNRRKFIILVHLSFALQTNYSPPAPYKDGQRWQITLEQDIDISINLDAASKMPGEIDLKLSKTDYQYTNSFIVQYCPIIIYVNLE